MTREDIAKRFGVSLPRVSQILGPNSGPRKHRVGTIPPDLLPEMIRLYSCGLTLAEIGERFGYTGVAVQQKISGLEGYEPRRGGSWPGADKNPEIPTWVPEPMRPRYARLARVHGEHIAASCIRTAKRLGISV